MQMDISVRDLQNDAIKPSDIGGLEILVDSGTNKVRIIDITLGFLMPPRVCNNNPILRQIYTKLTCTNLT